MIVELDLSAGSAPRLLEVDNFKGFKLVVRGPRDPDRARNALDGFARWLGDDHVAIPQATILGLAGTAAASEAWQDGFAAMVTYAEAKGWLLDGAIKAHVEWDPSAAGQRPGPQTPERDA